MTVELALARAGAGCAAPVWDVGSASLLWVAGSTVRRLHPGSGVDAETVFPQPIGGVAARKNGGLVCHLRDGIGVRDLDDQLRWLVYWQREDFRAGSAAIDPAGRLWAITHRADGEPGGQLLRVTPEGRATVVLDDLGTGAALAWNAAADRMYLADADVTVFDYDATTGEIANRRPLCTVENPTGLCVDADDGVWVAAATEIRCHTEEGAVDRVLTAPSRITGCCFGGPDFADLYLTANDDSLYLARNIGAGLPTPRFPG